MSHFVASRDDSPGGMSGDRRVLVIDSNLLVAEATALALKRLAFTVRVVMPITAHAGDLVAWRPGLAILDTDSVDDATCLSIVSTFSDAEVPVVVMASQLDVPLLGECVRVGASSVVDKGSRFHELVAVVASLFGEAAPSSEPEQPCTVDPMDHVVGASTGRLAVFEVLTHGEKCILADLIAGDDFDAIARRSWIPASAVRAQLTSILQKLGVNSPLGATSLARAAGWTLEELPGSTTGLSVPRGPLDSRRGPRAFGTPPKMDRAWGASPPTGTASPAKGTWLAEHSPETVLGEAGA